MPAWILVVGGYEALATKIVVWGLFALGFDIILGFTGYLSFGHAAFFGTAAYAAGFSLKHLTPNILPALGISIVTTILVGGLIGSLSLRRSGIYFSILSLAFAEMLHAAALSIFQKYTGGDNGLTGLPLPMLFGLQMQGLAVFYCAAAILIIGFLVAWKIKRSPFGLLLGAIKENPLRLEYAGVNIWAYKMAAFMISAVYAGVSGFLMVIYQPYVATQYVHWSTSGEVVIMAVIGGVGTLCGPILGAGFMLYFENVIQTMIGEQWRLVLGLIFVLVVIFLPGGFVALGRTIWQQLGSTVRWRRRSVPARTPAVRPRRPARYGPAPEMEENAMPAKAILSVRGVSKSFGGLKALRDVNLTVEEGSTHAIIGPNGAGKSTFLNVLVGLIAADEGVILYNGMPLLGLSPYKIMQQGIARGFQTPQIFPALSLAENVAIAAFAKRDGPCAMRVRESLRPGHPVIEEAVAMLCDVGLADHIGKAAHHLSRGDKRRLELALCLVTKPRLLLLDEPTAGMSRHDTDSTIDLLRALSRRGMTKIIIEHDMRVVFSLADRISVLAQGHVIAEGCPEQVRTDPKVQEAYLGGAHH